MNGDAEGSRTLAPTTAEEARQIVQQAAERREAIYPVGGGLALDELLPKPRPGIDLSLAGLDRVVEFSPRDLTITVEAGMTLAKLAEIVDEERLLFPFASRLDETSTIGGLLATAWNGPRRTGWGNLRDYVIGVRAIDGRGVSFKSGGKVVKNVTGYDFCKLLVGSRGTLGVITEVTLRLKPKPEAEFFAVLRPTGGQSLEAICEELRSANTPNSVFEVLRSGKHPYLNVPECNVFLAWEGTVEEIDTAKEYIERLSRSGRYRGGPFRFAVDRLVRNEADASADHVFSILIQASPTIAIQALSSSFEAKLEREGARCLVWPRIGRAMLDWSSLLESESAAETLAALRRRIGDEGYVSVLRDRVGVAPTRELRFGRTSSPQFLMDRVKAAMDPHGILNPGRYVFEDAAKEPLA